MASVLNTDYNDPEKPVAYDPGTVAAPKTVATGSNYITPESTVSQQLATILAQGSPLQSIAEDRSRQEAQRKGLLSSSMAVGAGQKALTESALPIAQQDAKTYATSALSQQEAQQRLGQTEFEGQLTSDLSTQKSKEAVDLTGYQGKITAALKGQEGGIQSALQGEEGDIRSRQIAETGVEQRKAIGTTGLEDRATALTRGQQDRLAIETTGSQNRLELGVKYTNDFNLALQNERIQDERFAADISSKELIAANALSQEKRADYAKDSQLLMQQYSSDIAKIMSSETLSGAAKVTSVANLKAAVISEVEMLGKLHSVPVTWPSVWLSDPTTGIQV